MDKTGRITVGGRQQTSKALLGAAVVFLLPGILSWSIRGIQFTPWDWIRIGGCALFVSMALWARWAPLVPAVISTVVYLSYLTYYVADVFAWHLMMWIIHVAILLLLGVAIYSATRGDGEVAEAGE